VCEPEGLEGPQPPSRATPSFFGHTLNFSGRSQQPEMKKKTEFITRQKNGINSVQQDEVLEIRDLC